MYAVIETGGKQYRVTPGEQVEVETLTGEVGSEVDLGRVLAVVDGDTVSAGSAVEATRVKATITAHGRGDKVIVFKFKRKKQYRRTIGHRQNYTRVQINEIV
jgi:large subunit ribosomal protein L21